ncbi:aldolase [Virgibacillus sp. C22-A2]|uniref:Aldolase n=1 Tax=Virgibacillus tibetensis TaxID=3042313 RepID=A0ABU6KGN4_9BACI|nr:aldolase [Virgibacillus sp. C22-A2]
MADIAGDTIYKAFGLTISSDFYLPELPQLPRIKAPDIVVRKADLLQLWVEMTEPNRHFSVQENFCMFEVPEVAIYMVESGSTISVYPYDQANEDQVRLYILGTCMGALLMQRKTLPLHGSAVAIDGNAYAIVGDSGAGKSTLASVFLQKGYHLLSDDVIPVTLTEDHTPIVTPAYPQQKLWMESLNQFGMESKHLRPIIDRETKFAVPVSDQFADKPLPLAGVFELIKKEDEEIKANCIQKLERFHTLFQHTYRNFLLERSGLMDWHFNTTAKIVNKLEIYQLCRPEFRFSAHDLAEIILTKIKKDVKV